MNSKYMIRFIYVAFSLILTAFICHIFINNFFFNINERATVERMVYGVAHKPFVYRILLPCTVRAVMSCIPYKLKQSLTRSLGDSSVIDSLFHKTVWNKQRYLLEYLILFVLIYISLLAYVFSLHYLFTAIYPRVAPVIAPSVSLLSLLGLPLYFADVHIYLYDFTTLFLFTLGLALMARKKWRMFLLVYLVSCLNKETTILLTMLFCVHFFRTEKLNRLGFLKLLGSQILIFSVVKITLYMIFKNNQGCAMEHHFMRNLNFISKPYPLATVLHGLVLLMLTGYAWGEKHRFVKHGLIILPALLVASFLWGWIEEIRGYYEVYPIFVLLISHTACRIIGIKI